MENGKKLLSLLLSFALLLTLSAPAAAAGQDGEIYSAVVRFEDGADADALMHALEALPGVRVRWRYSALFSGAAVEGSRAALALAEEQWGVESLAVSRIWAKSEVIHEPVEPSNSLDLMNGLELDYDGDGMVVAVLDSGLKVNHEAFLDYGIMGNAAISEEDIDAFAANGGTDGRYVSVKIPFVYDYSDNDRSVNTADTHGNHVSALAAGYAEDRYGNVKFRGAAPAAQLLGMKVFPDDAKRGADDADILKAMEDAYLLGADVINLSLGMTHSFSGDEQIGTVYRAALAKLEEAGVIVCCAVGNDSASLTGKAGDTALPTGAYTDYSTACAPAVYEGANAIAAVNAAFYEAGGGILAGERTILYTKTISEDEEAVLPDIDALAGQTMDYVVIGGLGSAEDFAGLELTGCAAVVQRGELLFSEKANNAAAAGAALCIIYNNEPGTILPAVSEIKIPCVMITQEDGEYLLEQASDGRGSITIAPYRTLISTGERTTMLNHSSWGAASLRLVPTLSAPGGIILSASSSANDAYEYLSGTSMATPNASGAYAVLLQALRERGVEDKKERAELARALLESTASLVTDADGIPLSPRRQGAGLIDLTAALESGAVIKEPLLELGESGNGWFTLRFTVKNLTQEKKTFSWDAAVLTDAYEYVENSWRSLLSPLDITDHTKIMGSPRFTVNAGEEREVSLRLHVQDDVIKELREVYPNGFYAEGYLTLTDNEGEKLHATFLGYCGDWEAAPIIEPVDFRDVMDAWFEQETGGNEEALSALVVDMGYNLALLCDETLNTDGALLPGENPWLVTQTHDARIAMSAAGSDGFHSNGDRLLIDLYTLRDAEHVVMAVVDRWTGEIYYVSDRAYLMRSEVSDTLGEPLPAARFVWDGTDRNGCVLSNGTKVDVVFYAWLESDEDISRAYGTNKTCAENVDSYRWLLNKAYDKYIEWKFPLVLDTAVPEVSCRVNRGKNTVTVTVRDGQFVAYFAVQDRTGTYLAEETYADERAGESHVLTFDADTISGDMLYITAADYAGNLMGYEIDLTTVRNDGTAQIVRCPAAALTDVEKGAWYHNAVDFVIGNDLMDMEDGLRFRPDGAALRVQVLEMLYKLAGSPAWNGEIEKLPFTDVRGGEAFLPALQWAYSEGIVTGYGDAFFGAYVPVRRAQLAVMLWRAAQVRGEDTACGEVAFTDEVPDWAAQALMWTVEQGYLTPDEDGRIDPDANVTRAEFAYLLMNIYENIL